MCRKSSCAAPLWAAPLLTYHAYFHSYRFHIHTNANSAFKRFWCDIAWHLLYQNAFGGLMHWFIIRMIIQDRHPVSQSSENVRTPMVITPTVIAISVPKGIIPFRRIPVESDQWCVDPVQYDPDNCHDCRPPCNPGHFCIWHHRRREKQGSRANTRISNKKPIPVNGIQEIPSPRVRQTEHFPAQNRQ